MHGARILCLPHVFSSPLRPFSRQNSTDLGQLIGSVVVMVGWGVGEGVCLFVIIVIARFPGNYLHAAKINNEG